MSQRVVRAFPDYAQANANWAARKVWKAMLKQGGVAAK